MCITQPISSDLRFPGTIDVLGRYSYVVTMRDVMLARIRNDGDRFHALDPRTGAEWAAFDDEQGALSFTESLAISATKVCGGCLGKGEARDGSTCERCCGIGELHLTA